MEDKEQQANTKKPYQKPVVTVVRIAAEEAVLAVCKGNNTIKDVCQLTLTCTSLPGS